MSDYGFVALAFGLTWTVLAGYAVWAWTAHARAVRAWREAVAGDSPESSSQTS